MLTFEEKKAIIETFPQLTAKDVSMKRVNYHFEDSLYEKTVVVHHFYPNGNGFVFVADLPGYEVNDKGLVNIREASEAELRERLQIRFAIFRINQKMKSSNKHLFPKNRNGGIRKGKRFS